MIKNIPNMISISRIIFSFLLLFFLNSHIIFILLYILIGITDILDGYIARKLKVESKFGARLDSYADFIFYIILVIVVIKMNLLIFSFEYMIILFSIVLIRLYNLFLTKLKYNKYVFIHTIGNKISGIMIYFLPIVLIFKQNRIFIIISFFSAFAASVEELLITIKNSEIRLNRKSIFFD